MPVTKDHPATADFPDEWRYVRYKLKQELMKARGSI